MLSSTNGNGATARSVQGRSLVHQRLDKRQLAAIAADILAGSAVFQPSARMLSTLLGVSVVYIGIAAQLSPEKRKAIIAGRNSTSFHALLNPPEPQLALPAPKAIDDSTNGHVSASIADAELITIARTVGAERMLAAAVAAEAAQ
jgi:hypothetical protein